MAMNKSGLGSDNMSAEDKARIPELGGKASHRGAASSAAHKTTITNKAGGGALRKEDQRKGGRAS